MTSPTLINRINIDLCRALGVDPVNVTEVHMHLSAQNLPLLTVTRMLRDVGQLRQVVESLSLAPRMESEAEKAARVLLVGERRSDPL